MTKGLTNEFKKVANSIAINMLNKAGTRLVNEYKARRIWTVSISADDDLYYDVHDWLMAQQEKANDPRRALAVKSKFKYDDQMVRQFTMRTVFDGDASNKLTVDGHEIVVSIRDADNPTVGDNEIAKAIKPPKMTFRAKTRAGRQAVLDVINTIHKAKHSQDRKPSLHILGKWNEWTRRSDLPARTMDSVIVKGNTVEELRADIAEFRSREAEYNRRGIPYHRAYLLTGPPGTGKTSSVKAVAQDLGLDLWYAQLSELGKDAKLIEVLTQVGAGILLLEDVDSFAAALADRKTDAAKEATTSGLLNALDGVATPHGLITVMTTNHPERLDPALVRPGRIDRTLAFENPDSDTIHRHFEFFYGRRAVFQGEWPEGLSSAAVSEIFKRNMDSPAQAEVDLLDDGESNE